MKIPWEGANIPAVVWKPSHGCIAQRFSYDCETTAIESEALVPEFIVASVFDGRVVYFIRRQDLAEFWRLHATSQVFLLNAAFDLAVAQQCASVDFHPMIEAGLVYDVGLLWQLAELARTGAVSQETSLAKLTKALLGVELNKDEAVRTGFGRYLRDGRVHYDEIPAAFLQYAAQDAIATFLLGDLLEPQARGLHLQHGGPDGDVTLHRWGPLTHHIQLRGQIALAAVRRNGLDVDAAALQIIRAEQEQLAKSALEVLAKDGYHPGQKGIKKVFDKIITDLELRNDVVVPMSTKGKSQKADDLAPLAHEPFVAAFLKTGKAQRLVKSCLDKLLQAAPRVHPRYTTLVDTGRTSCGSPNVQNLPRAGGVRRCVVPPPEHTFVISDYKAAELCTLAQITFDRYGNSAMRNLINQGVDLHKHTAANILNKPMEAVDKEERQKAKAVNFGLPGGLGARGLVRYALKTYGILLNEKEAAEWKRRWLGVYPEMRQYLANTGDDQEAAVTLTGRVRANCTYCQARNTPFQGLSADGAKLALYELVHADFRVEAFVHDEVLVAVPNTADVEAAKQNIRKIMIESMRRVCPDVNIDVDQNVAPCWIKP